MRTAADRGRDMDNNVLHAVYYFLIAASWVVVVPIVAGLIRSRKSGWGWIVLIVYFSASLLSDNLITFLGDTNESKIIPRFWTLIEFTLLSLFFVYIMRRRNVRRIILLMLIPFLGICVLDYSITGLNQRDELALGVESLLLIVYSMSMLYFFLKDAEYANILTRGEFWIISGILLYFGGNIFVFLSNSYVNAKSVASGYWFWALHALVCVIFYIISTVGLWKAKESR